MAKAERDREVVADVQLKFVSANDIPVRSARVTKAEWGAIERHMVNQRDQRIALEAEVEALRASGKSGQGKQVDETILTILTEVGHALHRRDVYHRLEEKGVLVRGEDPVANTGAHLSWLRPRTGSTGGVVVGECKARVVPHILQRPAKEEAAPTLVFFTRLAYLG